MTPRDETPATETPAAESVPLLTNLWSADEDIELDADCSPTKVCRNAREFTFEGITEEGGDLASSWKNLLQREGKLSTEGGSVRDLVLGPPSGD